MNSEIYSALDANINRCIEGIRVCEDIFRFSIKNTVSSEFKILRHKITESLSVINPSMLLSSRDVPNDEQKFVNTVNEMRRSDTRDLFRSNIRRAIEASRVVEEFSKALHQTVADSFQQIRFSLYDLEKRGWTILEKRTLMEKFDFSLYAIIDSAFVPFDKMEHTAELLSASGADIIQLRMKESFDRDYIVMAEKISDVCSKHDVLFIVNDRVDIALYSGADGVHIGQDDIPVEAARALSDGRLIVGVSVSNADEALQASTADYIAAGPVYDTTSKDGHLLEGIGLDAAKVICGKSSVPVAAIGGVAETNISDLLNAGITSFSVISALYKDGDIAGNTERLKSAIRRFGNKK